MNECLDMEKIHFIEGDSDSMYFAIAGDPNEPPTQLFDHVIKKKEFYDKHVYKFMPNPAINTIEDEKKILGCAIERIGDNMVALAPKCFTIWNNTGEIKKNHIVYQDYQSIISNNSVKVGKNINLQIHNNKMSKLTINKNALTAQHTKMIVLENQSCCPFVSGLNAKDYIIE